MLLVEERRTLKAVAVIEGRKLLQLLIDDVVTSIIITTCSKIGFAVVVDYVCVLQAFLGRVVLQSFFALLLQLLLLLLLLLLQKKHLVYGGCVIHLIHFVCQNVLVG